MKTKLICNKVRLLVIAITLFVSISAQARENSKNTIDSTSAALTQLIIKNYGPIKDDPSLSAGLYGYIHKKLTGEEIKVKENIADADDAGSTIDAIQVRKFDWITDGTHQSYGMIAQELQTVAPEAVSGDADSEEMMGVDYSKLVPMLIKEIQSLRNRVAQLEE